MNDVTSGLPGQELVEAGLADLRRGDITVSALLVAIGAPRLRRLGLRLPDEERLPDYPEHALYRRLEIERGADAHSRYNSLIRRLTSFERALERRLSERTSD
jgi:hypothetical protein